MDYTQVNPNIKLNNGKSMPIMGLGTHAIKDITNTIYESIKNGVRLFDCAMRYENEKEIGEGINKAIRDGIVKRQDLFIVTKLWVTERSDPEVTIKKQLEIFNLDYVDLYLDHWPFSILDIGDNKIIKTPLHILWPKMENLVRKGYTKSIGVSNYHIQLLMDLLSYCEIKPVVNQFEYHPYNTEVDLVNFCKAHDIIVVGYNSLCRGTYMSFHVEKNKNLLEEVIVKKLAEKYSKTPGQIALNFCVSQGIGAIPASSNANRSIENLQTLSFKLTDEEIKSLHNLNENIRFNPPNQWDFAKGVNLLA